eukprot:34970_1
MTEYKNTLICKYFHKEYNILRNEPITIRHLLALIIYTDISAFCTVFRQTYRRINDEVTDEQVVQRHKQLYQYGRTLYEAVEFFGKEMDANLTVYHGLKEVLYFERFTAYFNQPISTTLSKIKASEFADGVGIILKLKSGSKRKAPKYLLVSFLSDFPHEDEKLFYNVRFQIYDIIEAHNLQSHKKELLMLNLFQKIIANHTVDKFKDKVVEGLTKLITNQQLINTKKKK